MRAKPVNRIETGTEEQNVKEESTENDTKEVQVKADNHHFQQRKKYC